MDIIISTALALIVAIIGFATYLAATRANREQARLQAIVAEAAAQKVDADAFIRAKEIYEAALATMRGDLASVRSELFDARAEILNMRGDMRKALDSNAALHVEIAHLSLQLARVESARG